MLTIRAQQMDELSMSSLDRFVSFEHQRLAELSRSTSSDISPDELWVREGIEEGQSFGMHSENDHARFNDLRLSEGPEFPGPDELQILEREDLWGWQKLDELEGHLALATQGQEDE